VVFEHTGADTWAGSLLSMKRGGRLVTCGATSGPIASLNLMSCFSSNTASSVPSARRCRRWQGTGSDRIRRAPGDRHGLRPVRLQSGRGPAETRDVFGKILIEL